MLSAIEASKHRAFSWLLFGLNIRYVGETTAQILANAFGDIDKLLGASEEEIVAVPGIGTKIGHSVYDWLRNEKNRSLIDRLRQAGVNMQQQQQAKITGTTSCQTCLTT